MTEKQALVGMIKMNEVLRIVAPINGWEVKHYAGYMNKFKQKQ